MRTVCGTIKIEFVTRIPRRVLLEDFSDIMLKRGSVNLMNLNKEEIELIVDEFEILLVDEEGLDEGKDL